MKYLELPLEKAKRNKNVRNIEPSSKPIPQKSY